MTKTVDEVAKWLRDRIDPRDQGASAAFGAIRVFEYAVREMEKEEERQRRSK